MTAATSHSDCTSYLSGRGHQPLTRQTPRVVVSLHSFLSVSIISKGVRSRRAILQAYYSAGLTKQFFGGNALCVAGLLIKVPPLR